MRKKPYLRHGFFIGICALFASTCAGKKKIRPEAWGSIAALFPIGTACAVYGFKGFCEKHAEVLPKTCRAFANYMQGFLPRCAELLASGAGGFGKVADLFAARAGEDKEEMEIYLRRYEV